SAIRKAHPGATIDLLTSPVLQRLATTAPFFDRVVATRTLSTKTDRHELAGKLKRVGYTVVYDLDGTRESMELRGALRAFRGPEWIGPKRPLSEGKRALAPTPLAGPGMRKLLRGAGLQLDERLPDLSWSSLSGEKPANLDPTWFGLRGNYALLIPASNQAHRWPAEHYAHLARHFAGLGITSVIVGDEDVAPFASAIADAIGPVSRGQAPVDLCGKVDAAQLAALGEKAEFFVAGPSDELHLMASMGVQGVLMIPPSEDISGDALYGRNIVKLTSSRLHRLDTDQALTTLRCMGLLERAHAKKALLAADGRGAGSAVREAVDPLPSETFFNAGAEKQASETPPEASDQAAPESPPPLTASRLAEDEKPNRARLSLSRRSRRTLR
ncbi:MAG: glycosyltransferase family 9 protein, partial [Pseudomonadota bacterium]